MIQTELMGRSAYRTLNQASWIWHIGFLMSVQALVRGEVPKWVLAQFSLTEGERRKKLKDIDNDMTA
jgi:hypothetical protein